MPSQKRAKIRHARIVRLFAERLREVRHAHGLTQLELAREAQVSVAYIGRLESGGAAPGIDLVDRLAEALGTTVAGLLPTEAVPDTTTVLKEHAQGMFNTLLQVADRETFLLLNPLLRLLNSEQAK